MKASKKKGAVLIGGAICLAAFLTLLYGVNIFSGKNVMTPSSSVGSEILRTSTKCTSLPPNTEIITVEGVSVEENMFEISEQSSLILYGEVSYVYEPILLKSAYNSVSIYTDVEITPEKIFRGEAEESVVVRMSGGLIENSYVEYNDEPELCLGEKYLFFLQKPDRGYGVNGPGDYYVLTSLWRSVFFLAPQSLQSAQTFASLQEGKDDVLLTNSSKVEAAQDLKAIHDLESLTKGVSASQAVFSLNTLEEIYPEFNKSYPIEKDRVYRETLEAYQANLESGFLSQEEYDEYLSLIDVYAEEITLEQARELEQENEAQKDELRRLLAEAEQQEKGK